MALDSSRRRDFLILAAERQERERQIGADTSKGYFRSDATDMNQYNGDRSFQMVVRAGEDVQSRQVLRDASPLGLVINNGHLYINLLGMWVCGYSVNANTTYHVVATFNKATMRAKLYVAGAFVSESNPRETEATYSSYFSIGNNRSDNNPVYPFQGAIMLNRDFNYELTAEEVMSLDHNGDPAGYVLPASMRNQEIEFPVESVYTPSKGVYNTNNTLTTTKLNDQPQSNGFSGSFMRFDAVTTISLYNAYWYSHLKSAGHIKVTFEYRSSHDLREGLVRDAPGKLIAPANTGDAQIATTYYPNSLGNQMMGVGNQSVADAWVEIRVLSIESVGCVAEYLPQNISPCPNNPANTRRFMSPMSADKWVLFQDGTPEISDGAIKCYFLAPGNNYKGGIACNLSPDQPFFTTNSFVTLTFKAKCDIDGQEIIAGLGRGRGYIYVNRRIELTTEWVEYSLSAKSLASYEGGLNAIVLYPVYNQGGIGAYYIKDVQVVEEPGIAHAWLDSTKQLPLNDEYLAPMLETAGGYDLTTNGTPKIVYKMTQRAYIIPDLMDDGTGHSNPYIGLYFNNDQQDATYSRVNGKIVANIGSYSSPTNRPMVIYYRFNFIPGRYYRVSVKWSLISGSYFLEAFNNWSTDSYEYTGDSLHTEPCSYEYTTPLLKAADIMTNSYRPTFFFVTRQAHSKFSIDEVIIEEYE